MTAAVVFIVFLVVGSFYAWFTSKTQAGKAWAVFLAFFALVALISAIRESQPGYRPRPSRTEWCKSQGLYDPAMCDFAWEVHKKKMGW